MHRLPTLLACALAACAVLAASASAYPRVPQPAAPLAGNPADGLLAQPIEDPVYDPATRCAHFANPGIVALQQWLEANVRGVSWGTYRCERWGRHSASLHAENRAIDWHLDVSVAADRRAGAQLILLLLAPDAAGNPQALARRMGVEELIWDCGYWGAGMADFEPYGACFTKRGKLRKHVDPTVAHRNHVHIGMTKAGAKGRTSFWR
jgi:hypothetical protein